MMGEKTRQAGGIARKPRPAATVILCCGDDILIVKRSPAQPFLGGFHGFPGGVVDRGDADLPVLVADRATDSAADRAADPAADRATDPAGDAGSNSAADLAAIRAAALRELFEETSLLLTDPMLSPESQLALWQRHDRDGVPLASLLAEQNLVLDARGFVPAGNWLTPPFSLRRFDTHFFLCAVGDKREISLRSREIVAWEWMPAAEALARWRALESMLVPPTRSTLEALAAGGSLDEKAARALANPGAHGEPTRRIEILEGIVLVPLRTRTLPPATHTNTILFGEREVAVIDPAPADEGEQGVLFAQIEALARKGRRPARVLLTHHHPDHVGAAAAVRERYGVPVEAHARTAGLLPDLAIDRTIEDGDEIRLAGPRERTLRAMHTPGHAPGHLAFFERLTRTLIGGDNVLGHGSVLVNPPHGDMDEYLESLARMRAVDASIVIGGHGAVIGDPAGQIDRYTAHRLEREAAIAGALERGCETPEAIVKDAYTDVPEEMHPLAARSVLAHLLRLEKAGRARNEGDRWAPGSGPNLTEN